MRFLLDTNVLSEGARPRPDPGMVAWLEAHSPLDMATSALTFGEIRKGVDLLVPGARRTRLEAWISTDLPRQFAGRVLPVDEAVAVTWGRMVAEAQRRGRHLPLVDGLLLATAAVHSLTLVTRNERDCADRGVPVLNPWTG
jgi:predicted nucleic acid-binding protein